MVDFLVNLYESLTKNVLPVAKNVLTRLAKALLMLS